MHPNNLVSGNRGPMPPRQCMLCGGLARMPCTATAAEKITFNATDDGKRCNAWMAHQVPCTWSKRLTAVVTPANAHHVTSAPVTALMDSGTNKTLVGEGIHLEGEQPAIGTAEGIGGQMLPITGTGLFRLSPTTALPAMRVATGSEDRPSE